ncbi:hypothetical protein AEAC466_01750 [Asticcacaulis sp. AC466]|uniref:hypothetical protein n=1 Tax=Asticcacaulis sp. AC466 TaxID=1282362 RepID=UPI0003C3BAF5|nr:hypothetical protein [Asticcacaulis sp. AC466]ESQ85930.1 hypothetical protein AEAC466_01750 [Asticcacaulis sp. AC466]
MSKLFFATGAAVFLCLTQCSPYKADGGKGGQDFAPSPAHAFDVSADITPAAAARLKSLGDGLVIDVSYYGYPTPASQSKANQIHQIDLGQEKVGVAPEAPKAHIAGRLNVAGIADIAGGDVMVLVNGYSVTKVGAKDDQVKCAYYRDRLTMAQKSAPTLKCDLEKAD